MITPTILESKLDPFTRHLLDWRAQWIHDARPKQLAPAGQWDVWAAICGRGYGKTRLGSEYIGFEAVSRPGTRWFVAAPTRRDTKNILFEGKSGLLNVIPEYFRPKSGWNKSDLELTLINGTKIFGHTAEKPDSWRGPEYHGGWCDEIASWGAVVAGGTPAEGARLQEAWDNIAFGLRLGTKPRLLVTGTPRPIKFIRELVKRPTTATTYGSTFENEANLAPSAIAKFREVYQGTRKGEQELFGRILEDAEGALWSAALIEAKRVDAVPRGVTLIRIVVAIDPAVTTEAGSDETGIVVVGLGSDGQIYVLHDLSGKYTPNEWAGLALAVYARESADAIIAETNQGGDLVANNLLSRAGGEHVRIIKVHAKRGKYLRAEPVAAAYERGKVSHVGYFPVLESQMITFSGSHGGKSPDRLDALVYAIGELTLGTVKHDFW